MPDDSGYWDRQFARTASGERGNIRYGTDRNAWLGSKTRGGSLLGPGLRQQYRDFSNIAGIKRSYARNNSRNGSR
jgi:hypothetical protein